ETLGMVPLGQGSIPAVHADRLRAAEEAGALAVKLIAQPIRPSEIITAASVENALRVLLALGGSTNALIHLTAIAGRRGVRIDLRRLNELSDTTPVLVDLKPTGEGYMEDFHSAGGMPALLWELRDLLHLEVQQVAQFPQQCRHAAGRMEILHVAFAGRLQVHQHRRRIRQFVQAPQVDAYAAAPG